MNRKSVVELNWNRCPNSPGIRTGFEFWVHYGLKQPLSAQEALDGVLYDIHGERLPDTVDTLEIWIEDNPESKRLMSAQSGELEAVVEFAESLRSGLNLTFSVSKNLRVASGF